MSRTMMNAKAAQAAANRAWLRARLMAEDAKPVAAQVKPLASDAKDAASRGLWKARKWAAPQVERTGQVLEDSVAPKVAAALTTAARRLEPDKGAQRGRWFTLAGISAAVLASAGAIAAVLRNRSATTSEGSKADSESADAAKAGANAQATDPAHTS
jgi:hypothetical protein